MIRLNLIHVPGILIAMAFAFSTNATADEEDTSYTREVFVLSGGAFGDGSPAPLGVYDLETESYEVIDDLPAGSSSDIVIGKEYAYVAGDSVLAAYDLETHDRVEMRLDFHAVSGIVLYEDYIISHHWDGDILRVINRHDLSDVQVITDANIAVSSTVVSGDSLYVSYPRSGDLAEGDIGIIDLTTFTEVDRISLGETGDYIGELHIHEGFLYGLSRARLEDDYEYVIRLNTEDNDWDYLEVPPVQSGQPAVSRGWGIHGDYFYVTIHGNLGNIDLNAFEVFETHIVMGDFAYVAIDTINDEFYVSFTDWVSYGEVERFDRYGDVLDQFTVDIAPEAIAVHYYQTPDDDNGDDPNFIGHSGNAHEVSLYPNPAVSELNADFNPLTNGSVEVYDLQGRAVYESSLTDGASRHTIETETWDSGMYIIHIEDANGTSMGRFMVR